MAFGTQYKRALAIVNKKSVWYESLERNGYPQTLEVLTVILRGPLTVVWSAGPRVGIGLFC